MSYSINAKGLTKALALAALAVKMDEVVASQPVHAADRDLALKHAEEATTLVADPVENEEVYVSLSGSLSWRGNFPSAHVITGASINAYATVQRKE